MKGETMAFLFTNVEEGKTKEKIYRYEMIIVKELVLPTTLITNSNGRRTMMNQPQIMGKGQENY